MTGTTPGTTPPGTAGEAGATRPLHLAVALDGAGWHPGAWRTGDARPRELFTAGYWTDLVAEAERGLLDLVTLDDALVMQSARPFVPDERVDQVRGRLDAVLVAARVAPTTTRIGIVPTATTTSTEPFHVSTGIATLDFVSGGRAGWQARVGGHSGEAALFGRREPGALARIAEAPDDPAVQQAVADLFEEAADAVEVVRRLWDSWEDDAVIRDAATGRFVDRDRLHYIDFSGRWFSVKGPSITPRPPQGQPVVAALAHAEVPLRFAARSADLVFVTPRDPGDAQQVLARVRRAEEQAGRSGAPLKVLADLLVVLDAEAGQARRRKGALDALAGEPLRSDARIVVGSATDLADEVEALHAAGYDGVRLRPAALPHDLAAVTGLLVPALQERGVFRRRYTADTLRGHLGLPRPADRYAVP
jgi:alkanesulfonate monooxygenase SsuD/methylene tetrahydromethanopterin reductase-like flavin-dependent oxidoreductase (luciferase family)